jgi:hypothetical protein
MLESAELPRAESLVFTVLRNEMLANQRMQPRIIISRRPLSLPARAVLPFARNKSTHSHEVKKKAQQGFNHWDVRRASHDLQL